MVKVAQVVKSVYKPVVMPPEFKKRLLERLMREVSKCGGRGGKGVSVANCPIGFDVCYPSCYFWRDGKCDYKRIMEETNRARQGTREI